MSYQLQWGRAVSRRGCSRDWVLDIDTGYFLRDSPLPLSVEQSARSKSNHECGGLAGGMLADYRTGDLPFSMQGKRRRLRLLR